MSNRFVIAGKCRHGITVAGHTDARLSGEWAEVAETMHFVADCLARGLTLSAIGAELFARVCPMGLRLSACAECREEAGK